MSEISDKNIPINDIDMVKIKKAHIASHYRRHVVSGINFSFFGQFIEFAPQTKMWVIADIGALNLDFEKQSPRPDIPNREYVKRPGFYISQTAYLLKNIVGDCTRTNGNNIDYWGNQFIINNRALIYKIKTPLFYDEEYSLTDKYYFITQQTDGNKLKIVEITDKGFSNFGLRLEVSTSTPIDTISSGISGYPLLSNGQAIWHEHIQQAWDPKLLYYIGNVNDITITEIVKRLDYSFSQKDNLQRHALTFLCINKAGNLCILVISEGKPYRGVNIQEATNILLDLDILDAIVLGGKGDVQLINTKEGVLIQPLASPHDKDSLQSIIDDDFQFKFENLENKNIIAERPVPSIVVFC